MKKKKLWNNKAYKNLKNIKVYCNFLHFTKPKYICQMETLKQKILKLMTDQAS